MTTRTEIYSSLTKLSVIGPSSMTVWIGTMYVATVPFDPIPINFGRTLAFPFALLLIVSVSVDAILGRRAGGVPRSVTTILWLYAAWILLSTFWSYDQVASTATTVEIGIRFAVLFALAFLIPSHWRRLTGAYVVGAVCLSLWILIAGNEEYIGRATLNGADENALALSLTVGFALCLAKMSEWKKALAPLLLLPAGVIALATIATGSRTGLGAMVLVISISLLSAKQWRRPFQTLLTVASSVAALVYVEKAGILPDRIVAFLESPSIADESRVAITSEYMKYPEWMLTGVGIKADAAFLQRATGYFAYVHNLYLGTWVQLGVPGIVLLVALLVAVGRTAWKSERRDMWISVAAPTFAFTMTLGGQTSDVYWFVIGLGVAISGPSFQQIESE